MLHVHHLRESLFVLVLFFSKLTIAMFYLMLVQQLMHLQ